MAAPPPGPAPAAPHEAPSLQTVGGGRYQARCIRCTRASIPIPTIDAPHAWLELTKIGWRPCRTRRGAGRDVLCPGCARGGSP
jgi:hypothetical protein